MASTTGAVQSEFMTVRELSEEAHIPTETLRYWRANDSGPASFKVGKRVLYRRSEVDAWFAEQEAATRRGGSAA